MWVTQRRKYWLKLTLLNVAARIEQTVVPWPTPLLKLRQSWEVSIDTKRLHFELEWLQPNPFSTLQFSILHPSVKYVLCMFVQLPSANWKTVHISTISSTRQSRQAMGISACVTFFVCCLHEALWGRVIMHMRHQFSLVQQQQQHSTLHRIPGMMLELAKGKVKRKEGQLCVTAITGRSGWKSKHQENKRLCMDLARTVLKEFFFVPDFHPNFVFSKSFIRGEVNFQKFNCKMILFSKQCSFSHRCLLFIKVIIII